MSAPVPKKKARSLVIGCFGVAAAILVAVISLRASQGLPWENYTEVAVEFEDVGSLSSGDAVRTNSVRVGKVKDVEFRDGAAVAVLQIKGDVQVYENATAVLADESSLAKKFVEFDPGDEASGEMASGRSIPKAQTMRATDLNDLLSSLDPKTRKSLGVTVRSLGGGAAGHSADLHDLLDAAPGILNGAEQITGRLSTQRANVSGLVSEVDRLADEFQGHEQDLSALVQDLGTTLEAVNVDDRRPLESTLDELPSTLAAADKSLAAINAPLRDTRRAVTDLRPGAESLGKATPDLRGVLREGVAPLDRVPGVASQANPAVDSLTTAMADARPLAPQLSEGLTDLAPVLQILAPYSEDIISFGGRLRSMVSEKVAPQKHVARLGVALPHLGVASGGVLEDPMNHRVGYPAPGDVDHYRAPSLLEGN